MLHDCAIYGLASLRRYTGDMFGVTSWLSLAGTTAFVAHVANEVRGAVLAVPVLWAMYESGGTWMAIWLGICSLMGIALSVVVPWFGLRFAERRWGLKLVAQPALARVRKTATY